MNRSWSLPLLLAVPVCLLLCMASPARAATTPPGVNIRWDQCYGDGGVANKTFACDTNSGSERLVLSFVLDQGMTQVSGQEITLTFNSASATLPDWWQYLNAGSCRLTSLGTGPVTLPGGSSCVQWSTSGQLVDALAAYSIGSQGPNYARLLAVSAVPSADAATLDPNIEYVLAAITIDHAKTVGPGACAGCAVPVCLVFTSLNILTASSASRFTNGANGPESLVATWQNGKATNLAIDCSLGGCLAFMTCILDPSTPTRGSTWGAVKALYR